MRKQRTVIACVLLALLLGGCAKTPAKSGGDTSKDTEVSTSAGTKQPSPPEQSLPDADSGSMALPSARKALEDSGMTVGAAFLGYVGYETAKDDINNMIKDTFEPLYPFIQGYEDVIDCGGAELYAILPAAGWSASVFRVTVTDSGEFDDHTDEPVYTGKADEVIVLRCNVSEIYPDTLIRLTKDGETFDYRPALSMMDGHLAGTEGCLDLSVYNDVSFDENDVQIAFELLRETEDVNNLMKSGMSLLYTGAIQQIDGRPCMVFALGTNHDDAFVQERQYAVSDNMIYIYDAEKDTWEILGLG